MSAICPEAKVERLVDASNLALSMGKITVHDAEKLMGLMESVRPVTPFAALHYRAFQRQLLGSKVNFRIPSKIIILNPLSKANLLWWTAETGFRANCTARLREAPPTLHIWADASLSAGGAHSSRGEYFQRDWSPQEMVLDPHINLLELRAAKEALFKFAKIGDIVRLHLDSKVACSYVRKQGGT